ncbi:MAG: DUF4124 domain-containing protein [Halobacteria archaeon]|nr:DUF4124 domain-containing protein [Halobacteria archaeon]
MALAICLFVVLPVEAEVYKWTDEQGRVHFSDTPPAEDAHGYQLRTPASADNASPQESLTDAERRARQRKLSDSLEADRRENEQAAAKRNKQKMIREHNCKVARVDLSASKQANLIYDYDQQGNRFYYSEAKKHKYLESKRAAVRKWCE